MNDEINFIPPPGYFDDYERDVESLLRCYRSKKRNMTITFSETPFSDPQAFAFISVHPYKPGLKNGVSTKTEGEDLLIHFTSHFIGVVSHPGVLERVRYVMESAESRLK